MKPGDMVFIRTTEEPVHVIQVNYAGVDIGLPRMRLGLDATVMVRRPVQTTDHGILHEVAFFMPEELETSEERVARRQAEAMLAQKAMEKVMAQQQKAAPMEEFDDLEDDAVKN